MRRCGPGAARPPLCGGGSVRRCAAGGGRPLLLRHGLVRLVLPLRRERETLSKFQESGNLRNKRVHLPRADCFFLSMATSVSHPSLTVRRPDCSEPSAAAPGTPHPGSARWLWIHCLATFPANVCKTLTTNGIDVETQSVIPCPRQPSADLPSI